MTLEPSHRRAGAHRSSRPGFRKVRLLGIVLGVALLSADAARATTFGWNVASGDWFTPTNWNPTGVPGATDDAVISNGGTVTLNAPASVTNFTLSSGARGGTGTLDVSGTMDWSGGSLDGVTNANGPLSIEGANEKYFPAGTLNSNFSAIWTGAGNIRFDYGGPVMNIAAGTIFDVQTDADVTGSGGASFMTINNAGTFQKSAGAGTTSIGNGYGNAFNNSGTVDVQTGTLSFTGGGTSTGTFDATGATLDFAGGTHNLSAATAITGGTVTFTGATVNDAGSYTAGATTVTGGTANFTGPAATFGALSVSGNGTLTVSTSAASNATTFSLQFAGTRNGSATLNVSGAMTWSAGTISGGVTSANGGLSFTGATEKYFPAGTLTINSASTWSGTGNIRFDYGGPVLNIASGATLDVQTDADVTGSGGASFITINNAGTLQKSAGAGTTSIGDGYGNAFNNSGVVDVQSGTLSLTGGGTSSGSFDSTGATLDFAGGTHTLTGTAAVTGGNVTVTGATVNDAGSYSVGSTSVTSGTLNVSGSGAALGAAAVSVNGTLNVSTGSPSNAASFALQAGGTRGGNGTLNVSGAMNWTGGRIGGGVTTANGTLSIAAAFGKELFGGTLNSNCPATWTGTGDIIFGGATLNIGAGTTFDVQNDAAITGNGGSAFITVNNAGTFQKSAGSGTTSIGNGYGNAFNNSGTTQGLSGTLAFTGSYTQTAGATRLNGGAISSSQTMSIQGGTLEGVGTLTANVNNSGGTLSPGLSPGQLGDTGNYTQGASGAFTTEIGGLTVGTEYDRAAVTGAATLAGTLNIALINGYEPNVGDTFTIMTFGSRSGDFTTVNGTGIPNGKTFQKIVNPTSVVLQVVTTTTSTTTSTSTSTSTTTSTSTSTSSTTTTSTSSTTTTTLGGVGHLKCYKARDGRAKSTYTLDLVPAPGTGFAFESGCMLSLGARAICVEVTKDNVVPPPPGGGPTIPPNAGSVFLSYRVKCPQEPTPSLPLDDQFGPGTFTVGFGSFSVGKVTRLLVPALPGPANDHFECYKAKDARPKATYTMDLRAGVAGFADETGCRLNLGAKEVCIQATKQNVNPPPPGGGPGPGPDSGAKFVSYKLKCPKGTTPPISVADQFGAGIVTPGAPKTLLVPAD